MNLRNIFKNEEKKSCIGCLNNIKKKYPDKDNFIKVLNLQSEPGWSYLLALKEFRIEQLMEQLLKEVLSGKDPNITAGEIKGMNWLFDEITYVGKKFNK